MKNERRGGGGGGAGGLNRWVSVVGRFSPFNLHKWVLKLGLKNLEKLMYCAGNERLHKTKTEEDEQCAQKKFCNRTKLRNPMKFCKPVNFYTTVKALPSATPAKQRTKFMRKCK